MRSSIQKSETSNVPVRSNEHCKSANPFQDNRPETITQQKLKNDIANSPQVQRTAQLQRIMEKPNLKKEFISHGAVVQAKLREEDAKFVMDFLTINFTGTEDEYELEAGDIRRIYHTVTEKASNRHQATVMTMRAVRNLYKAKFPKKEATGNAEIETEVEHGYSGKDGADFTLAQKGRLEDLVTAYNVVLGGGDILRSASHVDTSRIGIAYGQLAKYIQSEEDLGFMLDKVMCPGQRKATKPYAGRSFMQIMGMAKSGIDCHNAYADALLECLDTLVRY